MPSQSRVVDLWQITLPGALKLLDQSRKVEWSFPTSMGRPVLWDKPGESVERLSRERDSFMESVIFLMRNAAEDHAMELAANVWRLWILARDDSGGRAFLAQVLDKGPRNPTRQRALALYGDSLFAFRLGKLDESRKRSEQALVVAESVDDTEALVLANLALSRVGFEDGNFEEARTHASEARRLAKNLRPEFGQAPLFMEASSYRMLEDYEKAASLFQESLDLNRRLQDKGMVIAELSNLGFVEIHRNHGDAAERLFDESEKLSGSINDNAYGRAMNVLVKALIAYRKGDLKQARLLLSSARSMFQEAKIQPGRDDQFEIDWLDQSLATNR